MLRLEKTVHFENNDPNSKIRVHRPLFCQLKFFQYWFIPPYEKSEVFSQREGNQSLQNKSTTRRWNPIFKPKAVPETKNFQNDTRQETVYNWKLISNMFQNFTSVSKDILFKKWQHEKVRMYLKRVFVKVPIRYMSNFCYESINTPRQ